MTCVAEAVAFSLSLSICLCVCLCVCVCAGTTVKLDDEELVIFRQDDLLGILKE